MKIKETRGFGEPNQSPNAYLTVCVSLCIAILLSFFLTLLDGVRRNGARMEAECVTDIGLHSIFAEYHRELMKQYDLFAIDSSYGTSVCGRENTETHLREYVEKNLEYDQVFLSDYLYGNFLSLQLETAELKRLSILTDYSGAVFRRCASEAMQAEVGIGLLGQIQDWLRVIEVNGLEEGGQEEEKRRLDEEIAGYDGKEIEIEENHWEKLEVVNPTSALEQKRRLGILRLVVGKEEELSHNVLDEESLIWSRMRKGQVNRGNMARPELGTLEQLAERFFFQEYLLKHMGRYGDENEEDTLRYQMEYLVAGNDSDVDNLRSVANRLCLIREAANAIYLWTDEGKRSEIRMVAELVCALILLPELTALLEGAIVLGWAYAESVYDVKTILAGGKIPLMKDEKSWHYGLTAALTGGLEDAGKEGEGLSYEDYLRILMMLTDKETLTARAMNMVEADIRSTQGNSLFRLDGCYVDVEAYLTFRSRGRELYEITRRKAYQ